MFRPHRSVAQTSLELIMIELLQLIKFNPWKLAKIGIDRVKHKRKGLKGALTGLETGPSDFYARNRPVPGFCIDSREKL